MEILGLISCALLGSSFLCSTGRRYRDGCLDYTAEGVKVFCNGICEYCCCAVRTVEQELEGLEVGIPISPDRISYGTIVRSENVAIKNDSNPPASQVKYPELLSKSPNSQLITYSTYTVQENSCLSGAEILDENEAAKRRSLLSASNDYGEFMWLGADDSQQPQQQKEAASPSLASSKDGDLSPLLRIRDMSMTGSSISNKKVGFNGEVQVAEYGYVKI